jgi:ABC-type transport system involved in multi-copper enzyme maturation permease subunit
VNFELFIAQITEAILWAIFATIISQFVSLYLLRFFGLPLKQLRREIEDTQNPAVGAFFFAVSLIVSTWVSNLTAGPRSTEYEPIDTLVWTSLGILISVIFTVVSWTIAHYRFQPLEGENVYKWIRRELIDEQNASLALFLAGLAVAPFMAVLYQIH